MSSQATETAILGFSSDVPVQIRWEAGNDFGEFGGGRAGFVANDIVIDMSTAAAAVPTAVPALNAWLLMALAALLAGTAAYYRQRQFR